MSDCAKIRVGIRHVAGGVLKCPENWTFFGHDMLNDSGDTH